MIPVSVVTGFLGSGKTTLIGRMLRDPGFSRTAVIVNEFGEVGLDHDLITSSDDSILTLATGCLCCAVQTDLARTLLELLQRRETNVVSYDRVVIETSGLTDPAPVIQSLMTDSAIAATHATPFILTLVDTVHGERTLLDHPEARHQVALADRLLLSKTDVQPASDRLTATLDALSPSAPRLKTQEARAATLFGAPDAGGLDVDSLTERLLRTPRRSRHAGIETFTVIRDHPLPALALTLLLQAVAEHCGARLLRMKGLVSIEEMPGRPAVIHGVRHVFTPPDFLDRWPSEDRRTRIVFIGSGIPRYFVSRLLDAIEEDVRDAAIDFRRP